MALEKGKKCIKGHNKQTGSCNSQVCVQIEGSLGTSCSSHTSRQPSLSPASLHHTEHLDYPYAHQSFWASSPGTVFIQTTHHPSCRPRALPLLRILLIGYWLFVLPWEKVYGQEKAFCSDHFPLLLKNPLEN